MNDLLPDGGAPDPFTPLTSSQGQSIGSDARAASDIWEPQVPAPCEPHELGAMPRWKGSPASACWIYRDADCRPLFVTGRFELPGGKETVPYTFGRRVWTDRKGIRRDVRGWHFKRPNPPLPVYGLDRLAISPNAPVLVCEGEKAADAAASLFPNMAVVTSQGGSRAAAKSDWGPLARRDVTIWPDNDAPGQAYAEDVARLLLECGVADVRVVAIPAGWPKAWDLADPAPADAPGLVELIAQATPIAKPGRVEEPPLMPPGFRMILEGEAPGLYFLPQPKPEADPPDPVWITAPFEVVGEANNGEGCDWGLVLRWRDRDGRLHQWSVPKHLVHEQGNAIAAELERAGLACAVSAQAHSLLKRFINSVSTSRRLRCVDRIGWHDHNGKPVFILTGNEAYGPAAEDVILQTECLSTDTVYCAAGTLDDWQREVARYAVGNDRLALVISASFAGPLLDLAGEPSGGVHLFGKSQSGKSTALYAAGSVWGRGDSEGQVKHWRATANGLEGVAAETCDTVLILDEIGQATAREIGDVVYMLANGSGKSRAGRNGQARKRRTWRVLFLSTGEVTLAAKMAEAGARARAGQEVRLVDVPADAGARMGMFRELHGMPGAGALARHLRDAARTCYGTAGRAFLNRLAHDRAADVEGLRRILLNLRDGFMSEHAPTGADGQIISVASRFALIGAAGELARDYEVLPWPEGEAMRAAGECFHAWLSERGGTGAGEDRQAVSQVRAFIEAHGESRFTLLDAKNFNSTPIESRTIERAGFRRWVKTEKGERWEYVILPETWQNEVCKGLDPKRVAATLAARGLLNHDSGHLTIKLSLPGLGRPRVYAVHGAILGGDDAE